MPNFDVIFKAYDVRGIYPAQVNYEVARAIGSAYASVRKPKTVAVGRDVRASGEELKKALIDSLLSAGVDVVDIGVITTDQLYFAVGNYGYDGGISVTASHNPGEYNGFKFAIAGGAPPSAEDMEAIKKAAAKAQPAAEKAGQLSEKYILDDYVEHVLSYIDPSVIKPFKLLANANFGAVGQGVDMVAEHLELKLETLNWQRDGTFPKGTPNPLLPENREEMSQALKAGDYDLGVAWDADADRCFMFTGDGQFVPSCYIIALLAEEFLKKNPGAKIIHDLTTAWVIEDIVKAAGGRVITSRTGHTFMKRRMREENAVFAGESSGHYYFKDSFFADNGIVPLLMILQMMSESGRSLAELAGPLMDNYKVSGEINFEVAEPSQTIAAIEQRLGKGATIDKTDGVVIETDKWRLSLRASNTEPLIRLNAEARDQKIVDELIAKASSLIKV